MLLVAASAELSVATVDTVHLACTYDTVVRRTYILGIFSQDAEPTHHALLSYSLCRVTATTVHEHELTHFERE